MWIATDQAGHEQVSDVRHQTMANFANDLKSRNISLVPRTLISNGCLEKLMTSPEVRKSRE